MNDVLLQRTCPICGEAFYPAADHKLTDGHGNLVCTPHCSTVAWKRNKEKREQAAERAKLRQEKDNERRRKKYGENVKHNKKAVELCDNDGNVINRFPSISATARETGYSVSTISRVCSGDISIVADYTFRYENPEFRKPPKPKQIEKRDRSHQCRPVLQFTQEGVCVARYGSIKEAARVIGCRSSSISNCISGNTKTIRGFVFMHESEFNKFDNKN